MSITPDIASIIFALSIVGLVIIIFIRIAIRIRRKGGSVTTLVLGASDEFLIKDKSKAAETIVDLKASKKLEEQSSAKTLPPEV